MYLSPAINPEGYVLDYEAEEANEEHHELVQLTIESIDADTEPIEDDENVVNKEQTDKGVELFGRR